MRTRTSLLVIDDDTASCRLVAAIFGAEHIDVTGENDGEAGVRRALALHPDVVLLDLNMPGIDGLEVLERLGRSLPSTPVIMLTSDRELRTAVRATRLGAYDYLTKPIDHDEVIAAVHRALETSRLRAEVGDLRKQLGTGGGLAMQMGPSARVRQVIEQVETVAASNFTVLVLGETGTGKELVAQAVHRLSDRRDAPFVALDCGAIPENLLESELFGHERGAFTGADRRKQGRFELAQGGTLFLDEAGNLPASLQAKLLRALESREVQAVGAVRARAMDVRFVAATNDDLEARVQAGLFRSDLYFRLAQFAILLPPLRERIGDIAHLAQRFVEEASVELRRPVQSIAPAALELLERHSWPGNVRELRNVVRRAVLGAEGLVLEKAGLRSLLSTAPARANAMAAAEAVREGASLREIAANAARAAERLAIEAAMRASHGNKSQAARALRTDYKTLHLKLKALGIRARDFGA